MTDFLPPTEIAICYHRDVKGAGDLAARLAKQTEAAGRRAWVDVLPLAGDGDGSAAFCERLRTADLLICVGGDGTVLHASEFAAQTETPIFGVRMGRLGFLTETIEADAEATLAMVLGGDVRLDGGPLARSEHGAEE